MRRTSILAALLAAVAAVYGSTIEYVEEGGSRVAAEALGYRGVPYRLAGIDSSGFDCSGLVYTVYAAVKGEKLPRTVTGQIELGKRVEGAARAGDLLFFDTTGGPSHVGIALDARTFVHAASDGPQTGVIVSSIDERYYRERFLEARRLLAPGPGRFVVRIDGEPARASLAAPVAAGTPLAFALSAVADSPPAPQARADPPDRKFLTLRALLDGREVLARRMGLSSGEEASVWLVPSPGRWTVSVEAGRTVLAELAFEAGGRP